MHPQHGGDLPRPTTSSSCNPSSTEPLSGDSTAQQILPLSKFVQSASADSLPRFWMTPSMCCTSSCLLLLPTDTSYETGVTTASCPPNTTPYCPETSSPACFTNHLLKPDPPCPFPLHLTTLCFSLFPLLQALCRQAANCFLRCL